MFILHTNESKKQSSELNNKFAKQEEIDIFLEKEILVAESNYVDSPEYHVDRSMVLRLHHIRNLIGFNPANFVKRENIHHDISPLFIDILTRARDRVAGWGGKLYFVYLPEYSRYAG